MKVLFDTSALVAGMVAAHPMHDRVLPWLSRARAGDLRYMVAAHSIAELYAVLSTLPTSPRITPGLARQLIHENVWKSARIIALSAAEYAVVVRRLADLDLPGGVVYDALIAHVAAKAGADRLLTLNPRDFHRAWPEGAKVIKTP